MGVCCIDTDHDRAGCQGGGWRRQSRHAAKGAGAAVTAKASAAAHAKVLAAAQTHHAHSAAGALSKKVLDKVVDKVVDEVVDEAVKQLAREDRKST